ncbi:MAG TPA: glutamate mutase L [Bacillota bacterium]|nr:glutamate mutase L [Bacillota bacterium]HOK64153.1 glutamate mutase L [Bacillota bacterium]HOL11662.1 glutamate mutase L [Bacillota bacterium]HOQ02790.1 glutamate mutase L [Bacillota bacterium]HPP60442.1 glutamate mutase L [Bacillota bacterium]
MQEGKTVLNPDEINTVLATDCGSTTTKAILIEKVDDEYRLIVRGEAPTTVEAPYEDVTLGARNAIREVEELTGRRFLSDDGVITPTQPDGSGADIFMSTSSAGGGLQMMVAGVVKTMTAESAARAALGAGAIVMDVIAVDDGRKPHEKIQRIRQLRPDMILLSGGIDGGTITHVVEIAELIAAAEPKPRLGIGYKLPVIYAGNKFARKHVEEILGEKTDLRVVDNLRPVLEKEVLGPAREAIHNLFMEHVMAQAPGYNKLMTWTPVPIMPTPGAVGNCMQTAAKEYDMSVIGVDIGGATTDVFSVFGEYFNRTVSANLGMSYSICNVLLETGLPNIMRWIPFKMDEANLRNRIRNKMIRPTTIPQTLDDLIIEQGIAREALRLAFEHHKSLAVGLRGVHRERTIGDVFEQTGSGETYIDMMELGMLIGSGGTLSHAPRRAQAALMLLDAFQPEGETMLAVDSIFMMPQLGILATVHPKAAMHVFDKDCLVKLGTTIAPLGPSSSNLKFGEPCVTVTIEYNEQVIEESVPYGSMKVIKIPEETTVDAVIRPERHFDAGNGYGRVVETQVHGGVVGVIIDCRGRPTVLPEDPVLRNQKLVEWFKAMDMYPADLLDKYAAQGV